MPATGFSWLVGVNHACAPAAWFIASFHEMLLSATMLPQSQCCRCYYNHGSTRDMGLYHTHGSATHQCPAAQKRKFVVPVADWQRSTFARFRCPQDFPDYFNMHGMAEKFRRVGELMSLRNKLRLHELYGDFEESYAFIDPGNPSCRVTLCNLRFAFSDIMCSSFNRTLTCCRTAVCP